MGIPREIYNHPMNINNRSYERFEASPGTWVKLRKHGPDAYIHQLIDVSKGGMSFVSTDSDEFKRGDHFIVLDFKNKKLKQKIIAVVRYVKVNVEIEDKYVDYKVGIEFLKSID